MSALTPEQIEHLTGLIHQARRHHLAGELADAKRLYMLLCQMLPSAVEVHNELGRVLQEMRLPVEASECFRHATELQPQDPVSAFNLGNALTDARRYDEAFAAYQRAIALKPDFVQALNNFGNALMLPFHFEDAEATLRRAIAIQPDHALAHVNLADSLWAQGRRGEAMDMYDRAVELAPDMPELRLHRAIALMQQGRLREGFAEHEWRWRANSHIPMQRILLPRWNGEPLTGKTILLHGEQGFGDDLQFIRFLPRVAALADRVILRVEPSLVRILSSIDGVGEVIDSKAPVPLADYACSLLSLPYALGVEMVDIPAQTPYLRPNPADVEAWRRKLEECPGLKVGIAWAGAPRPGASEAMLLDSRRSFDLETYAPLAGIPGISLISLQLGPRAAQALIPPKGMTLFDMTGDIADFADTAALVANLDLVISVDTSVVHVAGAVAKPVWVLSRYDGCWRWFLDREDSPWYPTARIFRQTRRGNWSETVAQVAGQLRLWAKERR
ncbi:MAG TPA: tetratricopeptide repeat-containing glycosyltransferase family protein [Candidatus Sulfotelmatobacter sp.]|jgi:Flp pilus assembly protein TadD|nr:tetratricopeptide repeat-containing glycosyltransferase family protein [Candidatus Sulfotelmatobacter sp.]